MSRQRSMKLDFRDNPNYITEFEINLYVTRKSLCNRQEYPSPFVAILGEPEI